MTSAHWSPFQALLDLRNEIRVSVHPLSPRSLDSIAYEERFIPVADAFEREDDLIIRVELPGIDPHKHTDIYLRGNVLNLTGRRVAVHEEREEGHYFEEIRYGSFNRDFTLPEGVTEDAISAEYRDGILEITVARAAKKLRARPVRRVEIAPSAPVAESPRPM